MNVYTKEHSGERTLVTSSLVGYRQWSFNGLGLKSASYDHYWGPGWNGALCKSNSYIHHGTDGPEEFCTCGFYANHLPRISYGRNSQVLGVIEARGTIIIGSSGFRAQEAKIIALSGVYTTDQWFRKVPGSKNQQLTSQIEMFCTNNEIDFFHKPGEMTKAYPQISLSSLGVDILELEKQYALSMKIWKSQHTQAIKNRSKAKSDYEKQMAVMKSAAAYVNRGFRDFDPKDPRLKSTMQFLGGY